MINRVIICGYLSFPHGSAMANYVQNMAMAIATAGIPVTIVSNIDKVESKGVLDRLHEAGIDVEEVTLSSSKPIHWLEFNYGLKRIFISKLKKLHVCSDDIVITYSSEIGINEAVLHYTKCKNVMSAVCVAEWYAPQDLSKMQQRRSKNYDTTFNKLFPRYDLVLAISQLIAKQFCNTKVMYLPMMTDPDEFKYEMKVCDRVKRVIFVRKSIEPYQNGLYAISKLEKTDYENLEFHLCGFNKDLIERTLFTTNPELRKHVVLHNRMSYSDLVDLYDKMHFLLLLRSDTQTTRANFPSKVVEMMTRGVIPIVSNVGEYINDYLSDGVNSLILSGDSAEDCLNSLRRIAHINGDEVIKMSANARNTSCSKVSYMQWSERLIQSLTENKKE